MDLPRGSNHLKSQVNSKTDVFSSTQILSVKPRDHISRDYSASRDVDTTLFVTKVQRVSSFCVDTYIPLIRYVKLFKSCKFIQMTYFHVFYLFLISFLINYFVLSVRPYFFPSSLYLPSCFPPSFDLFWIYSPSFVTQKI